MSLKPDTKLGEYTIVASIGAGGMGEVYRARDARLDRDVAIKVLPSAFARDPQMLARFEREAKAVAALSHPNILSVFDFGSADETPYVVTELLDGETLRERLDAGTVGPRKAAELGRQIARGLSAAHEKGIVHRDIKPENLFITKDGHVKILDFGLAAAKDEEPQADTATRTSLTAPGTVLGTVGYMSPEQVRGEVVDHRSDIFSLGSVLYEMVSGNRPFVRETSAEVMTAILREEPPDLVSVAGDAPPALLTIVRRCMEKNPGERFHSAHDLAFSFEALSTTTIQSGSAPEIAAPAATPARRFKVLPIVTLVAGLALGAIGAKLLLPTEAPAEPTFTRLTARRGTVMNGRALPDLSGAIYSATWDGESLRLYDTDSGGRPALAAEGVDLLAVSPRGELAVSLDRRFPVGWEAIGTLAIAAAGTAPRPLLEDVMVADWDPAGEELAVAREVAGVVRVEYPIGTVLYESPGWISVLRFHPDGDRLAIADHPFRADNVAHVKIVHLDGTVEDLGRGGAWGLAWSSDGRRIVHSTGPRLFSIAPGQPRRAVYSSMTLVKLLDIAPSGEVLLGAGTVRREMYAGAPGSDEDVNLSWLDWTTPRFVLPDGSRAYFEEGNRVNEDGYALFARDIDGSAPVQIGNGSFLAVSPDGRWAVVVKRPMANDPEVWVVPTGAGESRRLDVGPLRVGQWGSVWVPGSGGPDDGGTILFPARLPDGPARIYRMPLDGSAEPQAVTPEDFVPAAQHVVVTPDARRLVAKPSDGPAVAFPLAGGPATPVPGLGPDDIPLVFDDDGVHLYVLASNRVPGIIDRVDTVRGQRTRWRELAPDDPAGVATVDYVDLSADGETYIYSVKRVTSRLVVAEGLQ